MLLFLPLSDKAIDEYASLRNKAAESKEEAANIDPRLEAIVERMLDKYEFSFLSVLNSMVYSYC